MESGPIHSGAIFVDYDRDGRLDLYVGSYVAFGAKSRRYCNIGGVLSSCPPSAYPGSPNAFYHNNGDGTFTNVSAAANILQPEGKNLSVGAADYDNTGCPDLFVANDGLPAYLYQNLQNGKFQETGQVPGMAYTARGQTMAAMCISLGDYDNDGWLDLYISDFQKSSDHLWHNSGKGYFDEVSDEAGITVPTRDVLSFGGGFVDYNGRYVKPFPKESGLQRVLALRGLGFFLFEAGAHGFHLLAGCRGALAAVGGGVDQFFQVGGEFWTVGVADFA